MIFNKSDISKDALVAGGYIPPAFCSHSTGILQKWRTPVAFLNANRGLTGEVVENRSII